MKYLLSILILLLGVFLMVCEQPRFLGQRTKTYTITPKNQVGTDEDYKALWGSSAVPLRTVTAHNNGNCIYVAKNGNDTTGDGTSANPYLTIQKGIDRAIATSKSIVTVERNAYVGDMIFTENIEIPSAMTVQVEAGETAAIKTISNNAWKQNLVGTYANQKVIDNRIFVLPSSGKIKYSDNGKDYSDTNSITSDWRKIVKAQTKILAECYVAPDFKFYNSSDLGIDWTLLGSSSYVSTYNFCFFNNILYRAYHSTAAGGFDGLGFSIDDGASFVEINSPTGGHLGATLVGCSENYVFYYASSKIGRVYIENSLVFSDFASINVGTNHGFYYWSEKKKLYLFGSNGVWLYTEAEDKFVKISNEQITSMVAIGNRLYSIRASSF